MTDLDYVRSQLKDANKAAVARAVKLSSRTVRDIASGKVDSPAFKTVAKLAEYFRGKA